MAKKVTTRRDEMRRTTLGVIRAPLRVHCVVTHLLLAHAAILYVTHLSNKTAINRTVHAAHAHISFDVSRLYTPPTVMGSWYKYIELHNFADVVGMISLTVGDEEIYRRPGQCDTAVSLDLALIQSVETGIIDAVELLLAVGANPHLSLPSGDIATGVAGKMMDDGGNTIPHKACWYGHCDLVSLLLNDGSDLNSS